MANVEISTGDVVFQTVGCPSADVFVSVIGCQDVGAIVSDDWLFMCYCYH